MAAVFAPGAPRVVGFALESFTLTMTPLEQLEAVTDGFEIFEADRVYVRDPEITPLDNAFRVVDSINGQEDLIGHTLESETPSVCSCTQSGVVLYESDGLCRVLLKDGRGDAYFKAEVSRNLSRAVNQVADTWQPLVGASGSLRQHLWDQINSLIAGKAAGEATQDFFTAITSGASPSATTNAGLLLPISSFAHTSFQKSFDNNGTWVTTTQAPCHLVSPRHAIASYHVNPSSFTDIVFRRPDGSFQTVHSLGWQFFGGDAIVLYLDAEVTGITPVPFVPISYRSKLPGVSFQSNSGVTEFPFPALSAFIREGTGVSDTVMGSERRRIRASLVTIVYGAEVGLSRRNMYQHSYPLPDIYADLKPWMSQAQGGDSSSLTYLFVGGAPAAFGMQTGDQSGPCLPECLDTLTTEMNSLAASFGDNTVYAPIVADLSMFTNY